MKQIYNAYSKIILLILLSLTSISFAYGDNIKDNEIKMAESFVTSLSQDIILIIEDKSFTETQKEEKLKDLVDQYVDFRGVSRAILGKYARRASKEQINKFNTAYYNYMMASYAPRFREYSGEKLQLLSITPRGRAGSGFYAAKTKIIRPDNPEVFVDFMIKAKKTQNKHFVIFDIVAEGISMLNTQKSEFGSIISSKGIDYLIELLERKTVQLKKA